MRPPIPVFSLACHFNVFSVSNSDYYFNFPEKACIQTLRDAAAFGDRMSVTETYKHATHQQILHRSVVICISQ